MQPEFGDLKQQFQFDLNQFLHTDNRLIILNDFYVYF